MYSCVGGHMVSSSLSSPKNPRGATVVFSGNYYYCCPRIMPEGESAAERLCTRRGFSVRIWSAPTFLKIVRARGSTTRRRRRRCPTPMKTRTCIIRVPVKNALHAYFTMVTHEYKLVYIHHTCISFILFCCFRVS